MILLITEYEWKLEEVKDDGSCILDIIPTVGGQLPVRISISDETRTTLIGKLTEGRIGIQLMHGSVPEEVWPGAQK